MADGYADIRKAHNSGHSAIWGGWLGAGVVWTLLTIWAHGGPLQGFTQWGWFIGAGISTVVCLVLSTRIEFADQDARRATIRGERRGTDEEYDDLIRREQVGLARVEALKQQLYGDLRAAGMAHEEATAEIRQALEEEEA